EPRAAGAVDFKSVVQLLDAVLDLAAGAIQLRVHMSGRALVVGDGKAWVLLWLATIQANDLSLDDHTPLPIPAACAIDALAVHMLGLLTAGGHPARDLHQRLGVPLEHVVPGHGNDIL